MVTMALDALAVAPVRVLEQPFLWLGTNSLAAYAGDILLQHVLEECFYWRHPRHNARAGLHAVLQRLLLRRRWGEAGANNLYAAFDVLFWVLVVWLMQRRRHFWKI